MASSFSWDLTMVPTKKDHPLTKLIDRLHIPSYLYLSRKDDDDVRGIGKHDFRSVLLHPMLPNANRLRHAASEKNFSQFDDKDISHRPSLLLSSEESESLSLVPGLCCAMIALGAFFKCSRSSSLKNENKKGKKS